jgi:hypothetical protein
MVLVLSLYCVSFEGLAENQGSLSLPGPLFLPSVAASDGNTSGRAITASIGAASDIMVNAGANHNINIGKVVGVAANEITLELNSNKYNITKDAEGYDGIDMNDFSIKYVTGEPMLPISNTNVLIPPNADLSSVKLEVISENTKQLDGTYNIRPAPEPRILSDNGTYDFAASDEPIAIIRSAIALLADEKMDIRPCAVRTLQVQPRAEDFNPHRECNCEDFIRPDACDQC